jgi:hypothetical protein
MVDYGIDDELVETAVRLEEGKEFLAIMRKMMINL